MTDIDALIARLRDELHLMQRDGLGALIETGRQAADALTAERAKVAALEAEVERLKTYDLQSSQCITNLNRDTVKWADEATRWRKLAAELAGMLWEYFCDDFYASEKATRASAALTRFKQESSR